MGKLFATMRKDLLLLWRDRAGLLVLFVMPAVLVLIITLVQENVHKLMGETAARVLMVDNDQGELGRHIVGKMTRIDLVTEIGGRRVERAEAIKLVAGGDYQACIVIPEGLSRDLAERTRKEIEGSLKGEQGTFADLPVVEIYFDPTVLGGFRSAMQNALQLGLLGFETAEKIKALSEKLPDHLEVELRKAAGNFAGMIKIPELQIDLGPEQLLSVTASSASLDGLAVVPSPIQHNVPAWALFGMFFIVVPMSGSLIRERQEGTLTRLLSMPVPYPVILGGKLVTFVVVCFCQFALILLIGKFLLPALGTDVFMVGDQSLAALLVVLAATLAATGYGIMLGTLARSYEQASMFGSISVVAASAIGGVMVPVYAMPEVMRKISVLSPVGWGLEAFLDIFVRGGNVASISGELALLVSFALGTCGAAWFFFSQRVRSA
ncbi:MAG: ABC transporter permease [Proteobacteria bacterium]|nr:ABC transporter permease [Pseudomonadota bacterium]MBU1739144.1 ABC transporter permease [Pseudomonadota bacterium]